MDFEKIISMLETSSSLPQIRFYKYVSEKGTGSCAKCFRLAGEIFIGMILECRIYRFIQIVSVR